MIGLALKPFQMWIAGGLAALAVTSCVMRDRAIEQRGATKVVTKIEKANDHAVQTGKRAADRSAAPGVRGERDPSTRND